MYKNKKIGVVVPAYNESGFISTVIETIPEYVDTVIIVDDNSTDDTWDEISRTVKAESTTRPIETPGNVVEERPTHSYSDGGTPLDERFVPVRHQQNMGRGAAVKTGYQLAMIEEIDVVAVMDGDGQMDPDILDEIIEPVADGRADYAKGNRLISLARCRAMSNWRLFGNLLLTVLTCIASGYWSIRDPQNGYTAISSEALEVLDLSDLYDDYGFLNDMLVHLRVNNLRVIDVPMDAIYGDESSGIRYSSFVPNLSFLLLKRYLWRLWLMYFPVVLEQADTRA